MKRRKSIRSAIFRAIETIEELGTRVSQVEKRLVTAGVRNVLAEHDIYNVLAQLSDDLFDELEKIEPGV